MSILLAWYVDQVRRHEARPSQRFQFIHADSQGKDQSSNQFYVTGVLRFSKEGSDFHFVTLVCWCRSTNTAGSDPVLDVFFIAQTIPLQTHVQGRLLHLRARGPVSADRWMDSGSCCIARSAVWSLTVCLAVNTLVLVSCVYRFMRHESSVPFTIRADQTTHQWFSSRVVIASCGAKLPCHSTSKQTSCRINGSVSWRRRVSIPDANPSPALPFRTHALHHGRLRLLRTRQVPVFDNH